MWTGVLPAVTTKFNEGGSLDHTEMTRCFKLQAERPINPTRRSLSCTQRKASPSGLRNSIHRGR